MKVHLFDYDHCSKFPQDNTDKWNATKCGYTRKNVTKKIEEVTCKLCLREIKK
ncbi:MAG: hypothetical protein ACRC7N_19790 [Clostridium sp.]